MREQRSHACSGEHVAYVSKAIGRRARRTGCRASYDNRPLRITIDCCRPGKQNVPLLLAAGVTAVLPKIKGHLRLFFRKSGVIGRSGQWREAHNVLTMYALQVTPSLAGSQVGRRTARHISGRSRLVRRVTASLLKKSGAIGWSGRWREAHGDLTVYVLRLTPPLPPTRLG